MLPIRAGRLARRPEPECAEPGDHGGPPGRGSGVPGRHRHPRPLRACGRAPSTTPSTRGTCRRSWTPSGTPGSAGSRQARRCRPRTRCRPRCPRPAGRGGRQMRITNSAPPARSGDGRAPVPPSGAGTPGARAGGRQGGGDRLQGAASRRRDELPRHGCPPDRSPRPAEGRGRERCPHGGRHREQRQDDDLPHARRAGTGQRASGSPRTGPAPTCCRE